MDLDPPLYFPSLASISYSAKWEEEMVSLGEDSCGSTQSFLQERCKSGLRVPVAQSQSAATSAPGFLAASGWAQSSGHVT